MNARLIKLWNDLQSSYYFIPGIMAVLAVILATITVNIDKAMDYSLADKLGWFYSNKADGARAILSTIAASMMTVASVTFSITMVAVTSAAGQYGPRLIGNFMRDRANQVTLGTFTSTFVYCILILRIARTGDGGTGENSIAEFVPNISLLVALAMTLMSVGVMIFFIHHIPETLNVGNITGRVGRQLKKDINKIFPEGIGDGDTRDKFSLDDFDCQNSICVPSISEGYIQAIDGSAILQWAKENNAVVRLQYRPGDFAVSGDELLHIWFEDNRQGELPEKDLKTLRGAYALGQDRTAHQNILFLADELVEILARALSPGVNDPFTAINCINWFHSAIKAMLDAPSVSPFRLDANGQLRVIARPVSFERFVSVICDQSRSYIATDRNAAIKMLTVLTELTSEAKDDEHRKIIHGRLKALEAAVKDSLRSSQDKNELIDKFRLSDRMIADKNFYRRIRSRNDWAGGGS